ncbi:hypothetical protein M1615_00655 [Patescibacteria group bacterium]|nr:hypothetical protein [Patescibacteria group bacterium]MCL5010207.1 hypothetical protein [Patescibacteria group bacterium]
MKRLVFHKLTNIYRFFTDYLKNLSLAKVYVIFASVMFTVAILLGLLMVYFSLVKLQAVKAQNKKIEQRIVFWQKAVAKYNNYRDGYFELAVLEYRLKNFAKSEYYLRKVLYLDPGFTDGLKLREMLRQ